MFTSHHDDHQDVVTIAAAGPSIEAAIHHGLEELSEPGGHHNRLLFRSFEVVSIQGTLEHTKGSKATVTKYQVVLRAFGTHKH